MIFKNLVKKIGTFHNVVKKIGAIASHKNVSNGLLLAGNLSRHGANIANDIGSALGGAHAVRAGKAANVLDKVSRGATLGSYAHRSVFHDFGMG